MVVLQNNERDPIIISLLANLVISIHQREQKLWGQDVRGSCLIISYTNLDGGCFGMEKSESISPSRIMWQSQMTDILICVVTYCICSNMPVKIPPYSLEECFG